MSKISLCVPTYNRPDTLRQLIYSFLRQDCLDKELVISDDTPNDSVQNLVLEFSHEPSIKYFRNNPGIGFARNLVASMRRASGEYIILLGDDDVLLEPNTLSEYVRVFDENPSVGFVYANQVQFSEKMDIEYVINFFHQDKLFRSGKNAIENTFTRSIFIGGIGIRNSEQNLSYYPEKNILHPQVEFIGNIISTSDAYLIAKNLIGFRSHKDQLIFRAFKNKKIRQQGNHATVELFEIFNNLNRRYHLNMSSDFLADQLMGMQMVMMVKEKIMLGNEIMEINYRRFCALSERVHRNIKFWLLFIFTKLMPAFVLVFLKESILFAVKIRDRKKFPYYKEKLDIAMSKL